MVGVTIGIMSRNNSAISRRRSKPHLERKTFVYFTDEERKIIDQAAKLERRSISSFIANAALDAAEETIATHKKK
jgi:uncharacterized protein (DUF1778 family)